MSTTSRQSITLTEPQMAWLAGEAKALGVTVSEVVRRVIDQFRAGVVYVPSRDADWIASAKLPHLYEIERK